MDIVGADIPALLDMDIIDREALTPCTLTNRLAKRSKYTTRDGEEAFVDEWYIPLTRSKRNHLHVERFFPAKVLVTRARLQKLHRHLFHPSAQKLFNLIKSSRPEHATQATIKVAKDVSTHCDPCQRRQHRPSRFRVTLGSENVRFNERIIIGIMTLDNLPVLHFVDDGTHFSAAHFLYDVSTPTVWKNILQCWTSIYTGLPNRILTDQGSQFGELFIHMARESDIEVNRIGIEAHSSVDLRERYHESLRTTFRKIISEHPDIARKLAWPLL